MFKCALAVALAAALPAVAHATCYQPTPNDECLPVFVPVVPGAGGVLAPQGTPTTPSSVTLDGTPGTGIAQPTGGAGSMGWLSGILAALARIPAQGAATRSGSTPVTMASDQPPISTSEANSAAIAANTARTLTPIPSTTAESSHVLKASAGSLYGISVTATVAGYLMLFNATTAPADGAVTPVKCYSVNANQSVGISWPGYAAAFATGIVAVYSSTGCFVKTASATAFISGDVQ